MTAAPEDGKKAIKTRIMQSDACATDSKPITSARASLGTADDASEVLGDYSCAATFANP